MKLIYALMFIFAPIVSQTATSHNQPDDVGVVASCAGVDDTAALSAAIATAGGGWVVIQRGSTCASSDLTIPNLKIYKGGLLKPLNGQTVVLSNFEAGVFQTFTNTSPGQGTVLFHAAPVTDGGDSGVAQVYPQLWGCVANGSDCHEGIESAINSGARRIFLPGGRYGIASSVRITNNNFVVEGQSRVYTDIFPLASDIHIGGGPNAMFVNSLRMCVPASPSICLPTNAIFEKLRFTSSILFNGWVFWAEDEVQGSAALFSSIIRDCWIAMGSASNGFFHGAFNGSSFNDNEIENTALVFDLKGARIGGASFNNNRMTGCVGPFIRSTADASNLMTVNGLTAIAQEQGILIDVKNGSQWTISNVKMDYYGASTIQGGLLSLDTMTRTLVSNVQAFRGSGRMGGILIKDSEVTIVAGYLKDVYGTAEIPWPISFRGINQANISNLTVDGAFNGSNPQQVYFDTNTGGNVKFNNCTFKKGPSRIFDGGTNVSANITVQNSEILNGAHG
jgi:hypothetical protein